MPSENIAGCWRIYVSKRHGIVRPEPWLRLFSATRLASYHPFSVALDCIFGSLDSIVPSMFFGFGSLDCIFPSMFCGFGSHRWLASFHPCSLAGDNCGFGSHCWMVGLYRSIHVLCLHMSHNSNVLACFSEDNFPTFLSL